MRQELSALCTPACNHFSSGLCWKSMQEPVSSLAHQVGRLIVVTHGLETHLRCCQWIPDRAARNHTISHPDRFRCPWQQSIHLIEPALAGSENPAGRVAEDCDNAVWMVGRKADQTRFNKDIVVVCVWMWKLMTGPAGEQRRRKKQVPAQGWQNWVKIEPCRKINLFLVTIRRQPILSASMRPLNPHKALIYDLQSCAKKGIYIYSKPSCKELTSSPHCHSRSKRIKFAKQGSTKSDHISWSSKIKHELQLFTG